MPPEKLCFLTADRPSEEVQEWATTSDPDHPLQCDEGVPEDPDSELFACATAAGPSAESEPPDNVCTCEELLQEQRKHGAMAKILEGVEKWAETEPRGTRAG